MFNIETCVAPISLPIYLLLASFFQTRCPGQDAAAESPGLTSHVTASKGTAKSPCVLGRNSLWASGLLGHWATSRGAHAGQGAGDAVGYLLLAGVTSMRRLCPLADAPIGAHPAQLPPSAPVPRLPLLPLLVVCRAETINATRNPGTSFFQLSGFY